MLRKLGTHILLPRVSYVPLGAQRLHGFFTDHYRKLTDNEPVPDAALEDIRKSCPELAEKCPSPTKWFELRKAAKGYAKVLNHETGTQMKQYVNEQQDFRVPMDYGDASGGTWTRNMRRLVDRKLAARNPRHLHNQFDLELDEKDFIAVRALNMAEADIIAEITFDNVITLRPRFFASPDISLSSMPILPCATHLQGLEDSRIVTLLHEIFHSASSIRAEDECLAPAVSGAEDPDVRVTMPDIEKQAYGAYGAYGVFTLAEQSIEYGHAKAENNAESWAIFCMLRMLQLAYPEYTFLPGSTSDDVLKITRRSTLLHHCSLFDKLRNHWAGSVTNLQGYDATKDTWADANGKKRPNNVKELLQVVIPIIDADQQRELERQKEQIRQKDLLRAKQQPWRRAEAEKSLPNERPPVSIASKTTVPRSRKVKQSNQELPQSWQTLSRARRDNSKARTKRLIVDRCIKQDARFCFIMPNDNELYTYT